MAAAVTVRPIAASADNEAAVQALHERAADYVHRVWGLPPDPSSGRDFFERLPPGRAPEHKHTFDAIEAQARAWPETRWLRAVVLESNDVARPFWEHLGFRANGQTRPHESGTVKTVAVVFMKALERP